MIEGQPNAGAGQHGASGVTIPGKVSARRKGHLVVRRRRSSRRHRPLTWSARTARKRVLRTFLVVASVLLLMALGLYYGLARQESSPAEGTSGAPATLLATRA